MLRKRKTIQNRYNPSRGAQNTRFKLVVLLVVIVAAICAVITASVLGKNAKKSALDSYGRHNLVSYGGTDEPAEDYAALRDLQAVYVGVSGMDKGNFRSSVSRLDNCNAVAFSVNDTDGKLFVSFESLGRLITPITADADITAEDIADVAKDEGKISIAYFYSKALAEEDSATRALMIGEEIAMMTELANGGVNEIAVRGIKAFDNMEYVRAYFNLMEAACESTNICVVIDKDALENADVTKIISATEGYADAYSLNMSEIGNDQLGDAIERNAYFITNYNARIMVFEADEEEKTAETLAILESYGIKSYEFVK